MQVIKYLLYGILLLSLSSCGNENLIPSDYVTWVNNEENGLLKKKTVQPLEIEAVYKPLPYIIANEKRTNEIPQIEYDKRAKELEGMHYFTVKLSIIGGKLDITNFEVETDAQQQERLAYLSFAMQDDIKLVEGTDTLPCALYHFERSYDLAPYRTFVLGFEQKEENKTKDKTLVLDLAYFRTGPIKLNFASSDLARIPNLKL